MSAVLTGWVAKVILPILIPILTLLIKQFIDKFTPLALEKIPKPLWGAAAMVLGALPPLISPEMFVLPGFPTEVSVAIYGLVAMGVREVVDQSLKVIGPSPTTPSGI